MTTRSLFVGLLLALTIIIPQAKADPVIAAPRIPNLPLDLTGFEYKALTLRNFRLGQVPASPFAPIMEMGKRNLEWIAYINSQNPQLPALSFSSPETQPGIPIDQPRIYNPTIILKQFEDLKAVMPIEIKVVLLEGAPYTKTLPLPLEEFLDWGRRTDVVYGIASRWMLMEPYLPQLSARKSDDVRGYYFLSRLPDIEQTLGPWNSLDQIQKDQFRGWLEGMCLNSGTTATNCTRELDVSILVKKVPAYFKKYLPYGKAKWESFFTIYGSRTDIDWSATYPNEMGVPFILPKSEEVRQFLVDNIEDEWKTPQWNLKLHFITPSPETAGTTPTIRFLPGATPNVNFLGGNMITMDANEPLSEYIVKWTIRHEFGHVLGFTDCYVEFWDAQQRAMVNYQLDLTNIMCSRRGHFQNIHYDELKRAYYRRAK